MVEEYTQEEYWKLFNNLPEELKDAVVSPHTAETIRDICEKNDIERLRIVADIVGEVLLGVLSPKGELVQKLKERLEIKEKKASKIRKEIAMFILQPVKESLENLYEIKIESPSPQKEEEELEKEETSTDKDQYREPIK